MITITCDRCGPAVTATTTFVLVSGSELSFCGHHSRVNAANLQPLIRDVRILVATP